MDPSKLQSDNDNDTRSLEGSGTIVEAADKGGDSKEPHTNTSAASPDSGEDSKDSEEVIEARSGTIDTSGGGNNQDDNQERPSHKPSFPKRLWQTFNIYLLLFALVVLTAVAVTVALFFKDRTATKKAENIINSQNLSDAALKQLANTTVSVGNSKQVLTVESNAIFAGSVLVRNNLEVAGTIKVGRELQLPGMTVSGEGRFSSLQADNLAIGSSATVQGVFTAKKGISVSGNSTFDGPLSAVSITTNALQLNGDLILTHHITAGGPSPSIAKGGATGNGGTVSLSGSDSSGSVVVNTGGGTGAGCFATITFARKFNGVPHVSITPIGSAAADINYYVNRSTSEFSICTTNPAPSGQTFGFDYIIMN
jgi:cytoskeletal protein CcmA (bactofilin family)